MRWYPILSLCLLMAPAVHGQHGGCSVYQYYGNDTAYSKLVLKKKYNKRGLPVVESYTGYKEHLDAEEETYTVNNVYAGRKLKKTKTFYHNGNRTVCDYSYNRQGKQTRMGIYYCQNIRYTRSDNSNGMMRKKFRSSCQFVYDGNGNLTKQYMTKQIPVMERSYKREWSYDDSDRAKRAIQYKANGDILSIDTFMYRGNETIALQRFYPFTVNRIDTSITKKNEAGQVTEKYITSQSPALRYRVNYSYDSKGRVLKEEVRDLYENKRMTHTYIYD